MPAPRHRPHPRRLPGPLDVSIAAFLPAASSAPTPLHPMYHLHPPHPPHQDRWSLNAPTITAVFSAGALTLLVALLTVGSLT
ncbi:hypothetical protein ACFXPI_01250 [Streptomyces sp. NPDC059104]|uniref:hypothetical protein n=1 Tax=Streptomyces sp. NPDC059104 TaxID=3346729 RepID=UPI00368D6CAA